MFLYIHMISDNIVHYIVFERRVNVLNIADVFRLRTVMIVFYSHN